MNLEMSCTHVCATHLMTFIFNVDITLLSKGDYSNGYYHTWHTW